MLQIDLKEEIAELTNIKICIVGPEGVGKTSIINQLCGKEFDQDIKQTMCYKVNKSQIKFNETIITLNFWDCGSSHQYSYPEVKGAFYRDSLFTFLIFDYTDVDRLFNTLGSWAQEFDVNNVYQVYVIINKIDALNDKEYLDKNKTLTVGIGTSEVNEVIQLTEQQESERHEIKQQIIQSVKEYGYRLYFGSAKDQSQGYQKILIDIIKENNVYHLQLSKRFESDRQNKKKLEPHKEQENDQENFSSNSKNCLIY